MRRYLEEIVEAPPDDGDWTNLRWCSAKRYVRGLWGELKILQRDYRYCAATDDFETYDIKNWTRESVESYVEQRLDDIIESSTRDHPPFGADHFIETEIGIFDDERRDLLERVGAIEDARRLVHHMRADGAFDVAIERAVQLLFLRAIKAAQPEPSSETRAPENSDEIPEPTAEVGDEAARDTSEDSKQAEGSSQGERAEESAKTERPRRSAKRLNSALDGVTVGRGADWTDVDGLLAKMRDHVLATAPYPNTPLATAAALVTLSAVSGGRVYTPTGLNLAPYIVLLAETGDGKDAPLKAPGKFLHAAGLHYMAQPGKAFTVSGFEQCLINSRGSCVATCDEIGENLLAKILSKRAMASEAAIKHFLMELSGLEDVSPAFALTKRAANGVDRTKLHTVHSVPNASFSLFGASTHARFYEALSQGNVDDGSLNKFLIINADAPPDEENIVEERVPVPESIIAALKTISDVGRIGTFKFDEHAKVWPSFESERAAWGPGARELYKLLGEQMRAVVRSEAPFRELYARVKANALKVATLMTLSRAVGGEDLAVTVDDIEMGAAMALDSAATTVDGAMKHMAGSEFEENCKTVLRRIDEADEKGITAAALHRSAGVSRIDTRKFKDVCDYLANTGQVERQPHPKRNGHYRYIKLGDRVAEEEE